MAKGSIIQRGNSYRVRVDYRDTKGKRHQISKTAPSIRKAQALRTDLLSQVDKGIYRKPTKETVADFMKLWIVSYKPNITARSYDRYDGIVRVHIIPSIGDIILSQLTPESIQIFYNQKSEDQLSPRSVKYIHVVLHRALQTAIKWHKININPADDLDLPKALHTEMQIWNEFEVITF